MRAILFLSALSCLGSFAEHAEVPSLRATPDEVRDTNKKLREIPALAQRVFAALAKEKAVDWDLAELERGVTAKLKAAGCDLKDPALLTGVLEKEKQVLEKDIPEFLGLEIAKTLFRDSDGFKVDAMYDITQMEGAGKPLKFFSDRDKSEISNVRVVETKNVPGRALSFIPPTSGRTGVDWPINTQVRCQGKNVKLQFDSKVGMKGQAKFETEVIRRIFGSQHVILVGSDFLKKEPRLVESAIAHELQHYLDFKNKPELFSEDVKRDQAIRNAVARASRKAKEDFNEYSATPEYKEWFNNWVDYSLEIYPNRKKEEILPLLQRKSLEMFTQGVEGQTAYLQRAPEKGGHRTQFEFLRTVYQMPKADAVSLVLGAGESQQVTLKSGKKINLIPPPVPAEKRFYEESYDGN